jgi:hypothetical protein
MSYGYVDFIHSAQNSIHWRAFVNTVPWIAINAKKFSIIGPTKCTIYFQFISTNSLYMFRAFIAHYQQVLYTQKLERNFTPTLLAASRHNTHKNIPVAVRTVPPDDEQISVRNM